MVRGRPGRRARRGRRIRDDRPRARRCRRLLPGADPRPGSRRHGRVGRRRCPLAVPGLARPRGAGSGRARRRAHRRCDGVRHPASRAARPAGSRSRRLHGDRAMDGHAPQPRVPRQGRRVRADDGAEVLVTRGVRPGRGRPLLPVLAPAARLARPGPLDRRRPAHVLHSADPGWARTHELLRARHPFRPAVDRAGGARRAGDRPRRGALHARRVLGAADPGRAPRWAVAALASRRAASRGRGVHRFALRRDGDGADRRAHVPRRDPVRGRRGRRRASPGRLRRPRGGGRLDLDGRGRRRHHRARADRRTPAEHEVPARSGWPRRGAVRRPRARVRDRDRRRGVGAADS